MEDDESSTNIGLVCPDHAPRPSATLAEIARQNPHQLIGKFVKKGFAVNLGSSGPRLEHMWVLVEGLEDGALVGSLNNDPMFANLKCGDRVTVQLNEIEEILD